MTDTLRAAAGPGSERRAACQTKLDQLICWWSIIIFYLLFGLIFGYLTQIMLVPIPGPELAADAILAFTQGNAMHMQIGMVLLAIVLGVAAMGNGLVVVQMRRMSGPGPALAYGYLATLSAAALPGCYFCGLLFSVATFREWPPQILAMLYDAAYVGFVGCLGCFIAQYVVFATAIFLDKRSIFPKWLGYVSIWALVTELVAASVWIFKSGPYAWNGLLSFYLGTLIFIIWIIGLIVHLKKAIASQPLDEVEPVYRDAVRMRETPGATAVTG